MQVPISMCIGTIYVVPYIASPVEVDDRLATLLQVAEDIHVTFATVNNIRKAALDTLRAQGTAQNIRAACA